MSADVDVLSGDLYGQTAFPRRPSCKSWKNDEVDAITAGMGSRVVVTAEAGADVRVAEQDSGELFVVPQQAVFFVGGLFEKR